LLASVASIACCSARTTIKNMARMKNDSIIDGMITFVYLAE
jgi:hypothetical protein